MSHPTNLKVRCPHCGYVAGICIDIHRMKVRCLECGREAPLDTWIKAGAAGAQ